MATTEETIQQQRQAIATARQAAAAETRAKLAPLTTQAALRSEKTLENYSKRRIAAAQLTAYNQSIAAQEREFERQVARIAPGSAREEFLKEAAAEAKADIQNKAAAIQEQINAKQEALNRLLVGGISHEESDDYNEIRRDINKLQQEYGIWAGALSSKDQDVVSNYFSGRLEYEQDKLSAHFRRSEQKKAYAKSQGYSNWQAYEAGIKKQQEALNQTAKYQAEIAARTAIETPSVSSGKASVLQSSNPFESSSDWIQRTFPKQTPLEAGASAVAAVQYGIEQAKEYTANYQRFKKAGFDDNTASQLAEISAATQQTPTKERAAELIMQNFPLSQRSGWVLKESLKKKPFQTIEQVSTEVIRGGVGQVIPNFVVSAQTPGVFSPLGIQVEPEPLYKLREKATGNIFLGGKPQKLTTLGGEDIADVGSYFIPGVGKIRMASFEAAFVEKAAQGAEKTIKTKGIGALPGAAWQYTKENPLEVAAAGIIGYAGIRAVTRPRIEILKIPKPKTPKAVEVNQVFVTDKGAGMFSRYRIEQKVPGVVYREYNWLGTIDRIKRMPTRTYKTFTPFYIVNQKPHLAVTYRVGSKYGTAYNIAGKSKVIDVKNLKYLGSKAERYMWEKAIEKKIGVPVSLQRAPQVLSSDLMFSRGALEQKKLFRFYTSGSKNAGSIYVFAPGRTTSQFLTGTIEKSAISTPTRSLLRGRTSYKDVTKPFARAAGNIPGIQSIRYLSKTPIDFRTSGAGTTILGGVKKSSKSFLTQLYAQAGKVETPKILPAIFPSKPTQIIKSVKAAALKTAAVQKVAGIFAGLAPKTEPKLVSASVPKQPQVPVSVPKQPQTPIQPQAPKAAPRFASIPRFVEPQAEIPRFVEPTRQRTETISVPRGRGRGQTPRILQPLKPKIKPPRIFGLTKQKEVYKSVFKPGYNVLTWRYGKPQVIGRNLPLGRATKVGVKRTLGTLGASFKLVKSGRETALPDISYEVPRIFEPSKRDVERLVQKRETRLGSWAEVFEIQAARRKKKKKNRKKRFNWFS